MSTVDEKIRSLWIPLRGINLLLPNAAVAEFGSYRKPAAQPDMPDWLLGTTTWHGHVIPVISFEAVCGESVPVNPVFSRLMILNSLNQGSQVPFYAIVTAGLPGLVQFGNDIADDVTPVHEKGVQCIVTVGSEQAVIPDLDYVQGLLDRYWYKAA